MYHSAVKRFESIKNIGIDSYKNENIESFVFNVETDEIPPSFYDVDFIYLEPPWIDGYNIFNERVGFNGRGIEFFTKRIIYICEKLKKPFYIICGKSMLKMFNGYFFKKILFSEHRMMAYLVSNSECFKETTHDLMDFLFKRHSIGLDFLCGYGNMAKFAIKHNKKCILTDFNKNCISIIKNKYGNKDK